MNWKKQAETNGQLWDQRAEEHMKSWYRLEAFRQGDCNLDEIQQTEVGSVTGKSLLHLQCNIGIDTLSWARLEATVTGVDISAESIRLAKELSEELSIPATFINGDLYDLPEQLHEKFDIVYTSQGVLCWLNDLEKWAQTISHFLQPGGIFYIMEEHPYAVSLSEDEIKPMHPYLHSDEPDRDDGGYQWYWSIGDVLNSLIDAGLTIEYLNEYDKTFYQRFPYMKRRDDGWWHIPDLKIPLMFTLRAGKT